MNFLKMVITPLLQYPFSEQSFKQETYIGWPIMRKLFYKRKYIKKKGLQ